MGSSMTLEEKFDVLMKSYQVLTSFNNELKHSNEEMKSRIHEEMSQKAYLRKKLDKSLKQKQRVIESTTGSPIEDLSEAESQHSIYEEEP